MKKATTTRRAGRSAKTRRYATEVRIADISIGQRHRKDFGDLDALAASIEGVGLLQPIGVTPDHVLVFGERRLRACRDVLGWRTIPARVVNLRSILAGEVAENSVRKDWTISERVAIVESLRSFGHGGDRRSDQARTGDDEALTVDRAAKLVGLGGKDGYFRARAVVERGVAELVEAVERREVTVSVAAEVAALDPEEQRSLLAAKREWTVKEVAAHRKRLRHRERQEELRKAQTESAGGRCWAVTGDQSVVRCDLLIADPPFGITEEAWEPEEVGAFTKDWCRRWATCGADFVAIFWCQGRLWEGRAWFDEALEGYGFQQVLSSGTPTTTAARRAATC
jgi:ParB-like chromosome segregation protein Spo0J